MKTEVCSLNPVGPHAAWLGWLLTLLLGLILLAGAEARADKSKPGANALMVSQDKAELERQMMSLQERLTNAVEALNKQQASSSSTSENILWTVAVLLVVATFAFLRLMPK